MKNIYIFFILASVLIFSGCKKYVDVDPKSSLSDEQLFSSEIGFQQALSGVYALMANRPLFGDNLSMGFVSALAQNYNQNTNDRFGQATALNFTADAVKNASNTIWSSAYQVIASINHLIANTDKNRTVLSENNYKLIRGEALGLRAYLHFELLRLYGPAYVNAPAKKAIPYETAVDAFANIPATTEQAADLALEDLKNAAELLEAVDPIAWGLLSRRYKMNFYAVKGLEARIRIFKGDNAGAAAAAQAVVDGGRFPLIASNSISSSASQKDRLFTPELVFALRNKNIRTWAETDYFKAQGGSSSGRLTRSATQLRAIFENSTFDIRNNLLLENDQNILFPSKFWQTYTFSPVDSGRRDYTIPLIRASELYYILAETAATPAEGTVYLNHVRKARGLPDLNAAAMTAQTLRNELTKEYNKEFYAEGQTFYYYKRVNLTRLPEQINNAFGKTVTAQSYILPIPDLELEFNPNYN